MGSPCHIAESAFRLYQNKDDAEFRALALIARWLPHPQRTLLSAFVKHAVDRNDAAQFLLDEVSGQKDGITISEFLACWISLLKKGMLLIYPLETANPFK